MTAARTLAPADRLAPASRCGSAGRGALRKGFMGLLSALLMLAPPASAQVAAPGRTPTPDYHFRNPQGGSVALSADVLTAAERTFISALPELRVAVPLPPARPYEVVASDGEISGIHPEMLQALARTFGLRLKPVVMPNWSSALEAARDKRVDILMTLGVTPERLDYLAFTLGATPLPGALFAKPGTRTEPAQARFALERNYMVNDWVRRQYPQAQIITVESTADALLAVAAGRADYYLGSLLEASDWLTRMPVPGVEVHRLLNYGTGYYHFAVRKDWALLASILNKGIQGLRSSNTDSTAQALAQALGPPAGPNGKGATLLKDLQAGKPLPLQPGEAELLARQPVWRVGAARGLQLLNEVDSRNMHSGIAAEYTEQVARRLGVAVQVVPFDSVALMLDGLRQGTIDIIPFLTRTPSRAQEFAYSAPYVEMPYMIVARSDGPHFWNLDSLRGKTLALQPQHPLRDLLAARYPDIRVVDATSATGAMDLVIARQADAAVEVKLFANLRINGPDGEKLRIVSEVYELPAQFHFATLPGQAALLPLVNRALADIAPAEHQRMLRRWVAVDLSPPFPWRRWALPAALGGGSLLLLLGGTWWWAVRLNREVAARRRSEELLHDIAATVPGLAFRYVLGADGQLVRHFYTPGAKALLGRELEDNRTVMATLSPHVHADDRQAAWDAQLHSLATGERFDVTCRYHHPDGRLRWLHAEAVQTRDRKGRAVWTGCMVDVTSEHELQQQLTREAETRSLMLASASHELRAPTHTLSLALQALSTQAMSDQQRRALDVAQESAHTLSELLNDVLDAARPGTEPMQLRPRTFDLHQLLQDLARSWRVAARTRGLAFELQLASDVPRTLHTDPLRLKQVLINLLSNACKYTGQGQVVLSARLLQGELQLEVADTGIGIEPQAQERLGQPFVTLDNPRVETGSQRSTGLGLLTTRRLAALLGGRLQLHSTAGVGTRVSLTLPLTNHVLNEGMQQAPQPSGDLLVCDDEETSRLLLGWMLRRQGYTIRDTARAHQALEQWRQGGVSAIVTDIDLPGMSGLELIRAIRAEERLRSHGSAPGGKNGCGQPSGPGARTTIIVCSGGTVPAADGDLDRGLYDAYLVKPVNLHALTHTLARLGVAPPAA